VVSLILAGQVNDSRRRSAEDVVRFLSILWLVFSMSTGLFHVRDVAFYAWPWEPCSHAESTVWASDLGVRFRLHYMVLWFILWQNGVLFRSAVCPDFQHCWRCRCLDYISGLVRHILPSDVARTGGQWFSHFTPEVLDHRTSVTGHQPLLCLVWVGCDCRDIMFPVSGAKKHETILRPSMACLSMESVVYLLPNAQWFWI
jgi:hypothetical protein